MPTVYTLSTSHADGVGEVIAAAHINSNASAINEISARRPMYWPRHISLNYYSGADSLEGSSSPIAVVANRIYAFWCPIPEPNVTYDRIDINVQTAGAAAKIARLMIYADDGAGGKPSTLLLDAGTVLVDSTGIKSITISTVPPSGGVWLAVVSDGTPQFWGSGGANIKPMGQDSAASVTYRSWAYALGGTAAPSPYSSSTVVDSSTYVFFIRLRRS